MATSSRAGGNSKDREAAGYGFPIECPKPVEEWAGAYFFEGTEYASYLRSILGKFVSQQRSVAYCGFKIEILDFEMEAGLGFTYPSFASPEAVEILRRDWRASRQPQVAKWKAKLAEHDEAVKAIIEYLRTSEMCEKPDVSSKVDNVFRDARARLRDYGVRKVADQKAFLLAQVAKERAPRAGIDEGGDSDMEHPKAHPAAKPLQEMAPPMNRHDHQRGSGGAALKGRGGRGLFPPPYNRGGYWAGARGNGRGQSSRGSIPQGQFPWERGRPREEGSEVSSEPRPNRRVVLGPNPAPQTTHQSKHGQ